MMKYYIVDDVIGIVKTLENIVESKNLGEVIGYQTDPVRAVGEIIAMKPDIVLVDLLMSELDGIGLVDKVKSQCPGIYFVMISRVQDKDMIEQAYSAGVEFFISKPINIIEVVKVLENVSEKRNLRQIMNNIKGMFDGDAESKPTEVQDPMHEINVFLGLLGMLGEKGTGDIIDVCAYVNAHGGVFTKESLAQVAEEKGDTSKNLEQRIRRAIKKGLSNVASLGIDDYGNEVFQVYANYVFDFKSIKDEMDRLKGVTDLGGRVNINKFIDGLMLYKNSKDR
ncbi:MAG: DNA-binding domain-containing protein [Peptostreptococcaceae bacterium]|nr:DNA-binding domain-containing protein [Peptostreptococcaceae bacterium]MDY5738396.1 DNA-binding domain-containing protein [Anaerovoracaceae bacterium]